MQRQNVNTVEIEGKEMPEMCLGQQLRDRQCYLYVERKEKTKGETVGTELPV